MSSRPADLPSISALRRPGATAARRVVLPLGALAAGFAFAQSTPDTATELPPVNVNANAELPAKDTYQAKTSGIGKGNQALRDIPQSVTVMTERLLDDRNLDTLKAALHNTAGITFLAAEGGEEDIRLRGFSLASTGDIFSDGLRDPAFYDRDTFNNDRIELLRGSASMLFGRGSTGGAVNQVSKYPFLIDQSELTVTVGSGSYVRTVADFNRKLGDDAALRINTMFNQANNFGAGIDKKGFAGTYAFGIGTADEFALSLYYLDNHNGINYGLPWVRVSATSPDRTLLDVNPKAYYGMASDYNAGGATTWTASHVHRFADGAELKTVARAGKYDRDQRASTIRFLDGTITESQITDSTVLRRGTNNKVQDMDTRYVQSDYSDKFAWWGLAHSVLTGVDLADEKFNNYTMVLPAGVTLTKPNTTVGTPDDGAWIDESLRQKSLGRTFHAQAMGVYAQDLVQIAPSWKLLGGLRWDYFKGEYWSAATTGAGGVVTPEANRSRSDSLWSKRVGVLYQPTDKSSFHFSYGTSFNTSGDTYQYDNQTVNTGPEKSGNLELGAKLDSADGRMTTRLAIFHSTKYNERNRDPDSAAEHALLSGKRHSAGVEVDVTGRITPAWEVYGSYAWTPIAKIDVGAPGSTPGVAEGAGTRSSLTPRHSGTVWTTYKIGAWRVGGGLNARSSQTPNRNPGFAADGFVTADLMAEYTVNRDVSVKLNVTNVTNKLYADMLYTGHYIAGAPRQIQLSGTLKF